eukprot:CAMPEP_0113701302 /NCGR_PEP_ID=MMETSP0038_2-20120614/24489_1 /TAXON_ID=2898 /ORGANISM="Cryptomonas paramecium" /LENGTH=157 /DNA_ID=CAMNT_0000625159 /DNA_START=305 /DNA_END=775 /DNA_ORIENTATION=- /assembly_acc=CAM_ASM_000170
MITIQTPNGSRLSGARKSLDPGQINLLEAAAAGNVEELRKLLDQGASIEAVDYDKRSALHLACSEGHLNAVELLIERQAKLDAKNRWGHEPLQEAMVNGHKQVADCLSRRGAALTPEADMELQLRLCHLASRGDKVGVLKLLDVGVVATAADYNNRS